MTDFMPTKIKVTLAVPPEQVEKNIKENLAIIPNWYSNMFYPNGYEAIICSAGPSLEKYVEMINLKERMENPNRDFVVFCVKHALPRLVAMGIDPDFCVILDGRSFDEDSTHGISRKSLFESIPERTIFMLASMSNSGYANYLMAQGARVLGWHTQVDGLQPFIDSGHIKGPVINGGTSSGTRCISIANAFGIRKITLVGFDSCILDPTEETLKEVDKKGKTKYMPVDLPVLNPNSNLSEDELEQISEVMSSTENRGFVLSSELKKRFYSTGELIAQAHDFELLFTQPNSDIHYTVLDDGLVSHMFRNNDKIVRYDYDFITYISNLCPRQDYSDVKEVVVKT